MHNCRAGRPQDMGVAACQSFPDAQACIATAPSCYLFASARCTSCAGASTLLCACFTPKPGAAVARVLISSNCCWCHDMLSCCLCRINEHQLAYGDQSLPRQRLPKMDNVRHMKLSRPYPKQQQQCLVGGRTCVWLRNWAVALLWQLTELHHDLCLSRCRCCWTVTKLRATTCLCWEQFSRLKASQRQTLSAATKVSKQHQHIPTAVLFAFMLL